MESAKRKETDVQALSPFVFIRVIDVEVLHPYKTLLLFAIGTVKKECV